MADVLTPEQRSRCMSRIRSDNTGPETRLRKAVWAMGLRYRLNYDLPGKPDMVFVSAKVAVFVDGCFWHGCPIHCKLPQSNSLFWKNKLYKNVMRDREIDQILSSQGWIVVRCWEHEIQNNLRAIVRRIGALVHTLDVVDHLHDYDSD